jgi:hypothetical protein
MKYHRLVGCKFPRLFHMPGVVLVIHDGNQIQCLDPVYLYNLTCEGHYVTFAIPKIRAKRLGWL